MADIKNLPAHEATYGRMIGMLKWGTVAVVLIVAIVIWLIA